MLCKVFWSFLTSCEFKMTILPLEKALEGQNIPAYPRYFETFDVKHMVSIQAHQKSQLNGKSTPRPGIEPGPPGWKPGILTPRPSGTWWSRKFLFIYIFVWTILEYNKWELVLGSEIIHIFNCFWKHQMIGRKRYINSSNATTFVKHFIGCSEKTFQSHFIPEFRQNILTGSFGRTGC